MPDQQLMPGHVLITVEVERSIQQLDPDGDPALAGLVALARLYALTLHESGPTQNALKEIGPKLTAVLAELRKKYAPAAPGLPVATPTALAPDEIEQARTAPDGPADELAIARERAARAKRRPTA